MSERTVAGIDWASGEWLVAVMDVNEIDCHLESDLESVWESDTEFERLCRTLVDEPADVTVDDVVDALGLCVVASRSEGEVWTLPEDPHEDAEGIPMQMVYWSEEPLA